MHRAVASMVAFAALVAASPAAAHPLAPALLELRELSSGHFSVTWRQSSLKMPGTADKRPVLPEHCRTVDGAVVSEDSEAITTVWKVDCGQGGVVGARLGVEGLGEALTDALVRVELADGRIVRGVVSERDAYLRVPELEDVSTIAKSYALLGVRHILSGLDHLAFVVGLLLLVRSRRSLLATITSFTIGHSLTLSLATLGLANLPAGPVEVLIALTIYVLALELVREKGHGDSLLRRYPGGMALLFGLLHGIGFAGALRETGLPDHEIPLSLFSFNVGIEAGQLLFVVSVLVAARMLRPLLAVLPAWSARVPAYAMGSLAALWVFERSTLLP